MLRPNKICITTLYPVKTISSIFYTVLFSRLRLCLVGGVEKWEDRKLVGGWKIGRIEKFWFSLMCLVRGVEKWESGKLFCLVREKCGRMKNVIYMNWLLCEEMGKWRVGECNKGKNICVIYYPHHLFFLVFLPNWEDKIMWA